MAALQFANKPLLRPLDLERALTSTLLPMNENMSIAKVAELTGVSPHTLRYYERANLLAPVSKDAGGRRQYGPRDLEWIEILKVLRATGMPISRIRELIQMANEGDSTRRKRIAFYQAYLRELEQQIQARSAAILTIEKKIRKHQQLLKD
jgi:DNA-binding transcriptional MerR regulator